MAEIRPDGTVVLDEVVVQGKAETSRLSRGAFKSNNATIHKYPLFLDRGAPGPEKQRRIEERSRECIRFTAIRQPGLTLSKKDIEAIRLAVLQGKTQKQKQIAATERQLNGVDFLEQQGVRTEAESKQLRDKLISQLAREKGERSDIDKFLQTGGAEGSIDGLKLLESLGFGIEAFIDIGRTQLKQPSVALEHCFLYMPASVVYNESATWNTEGIGALGQGVRELIKSDAGISDIMKRFGSGIVTNLAKTAAVAGGAMIAGTFGAVATALGGGGVTSAIGQSFRLAQNPYEEQLFQGIPFRVFNFTFDFIATSETEYLQVQKIIKMFRKHSRPTFAINDGSGTQNEALYSYPNEFNIEFMHLEDDVYQTNPHLPRLHNTVLTNITTNFAPDGWIAHDKGEPLSIVVQMAFTEVRKNTSEDIDKGY